MRILTRIAAFAAIGVTILSSTDSPAAPEPTATDVRFFEMKIRPLLVEHCYSCHGPNKQRSDLRLDSAAAFARGGASGETLVLPGKPDESFFLKVVRHVDGVPAMPPKKKLSDSQIADLTAWVKRGAMFPQSTQAEPDAKANHWAFRKPATTPVPPKNNQSNPVDAFILAKLTEKNLAPAPRADKRTLLRRVTFDLTGLPPTPQELAAFLKDDSPEAFAKVVDRLLASPAYGERWGRHWLDVARYSDSNGLDENVAHGNAWRYRDYVIAAFNADKPYNRFLMEQIAGDLLPGTDGSRNENLIATGFLALGAKVLAEPDEKKMEMDIVDEQLDTLGKAVLGLTFGCARCHDHKFDPMTIDDYYGLAGIFTSTKTMENFKKVAKWYENPLDSPEEAKKLATFNAEVQKRKDAIAALEAKKDPKLAAEIKKHKDDLTAFQKTAPEMPSAMGATEGTVADVPVLRRGNHLTPGNVVSRRFPNFLHTEKQPSLPKNVSGRLELAEWLTRPDHPLTARVMVNRVWRWHFGKGIVASVDNFGLLGEKPSHPELLDWLAADFVQNSWSVKHLHRRILLSDTYQRSSLATPYLTDPDNRLLSYFPRRRLEAEEIRDSLLAVSGQLDRTGGGPALSHVKNRGYLFDHTSKDGTNYATTRRSVYLPVIRNNLYDVFQLFDSTDATVGGGDRATTTVPTQALFFLNSELIEKSSEALAKKLLADAKRTDEQRVKQLLAGTVGREPSAPETKQFLAAVLAFDEELQAKTSDPAQRRQRAWAMVCHAILASNEFVTVN